MSAVTQMSEQEQRQHGHTENRERIVKATRFIRELTIDRAYTLKDELASYRSPDERDAALKDIAAESGRDVGALRDDLAWVYAIQEDDLRGAFAAQQIPDHEWQKRIGVTHLRRIGKAYPQDEEFMRSPTSKERAAMVLECFHANWTVKELETTLVDRGLRKSPKPRMKTPPTKMPTTMPAFLGLVAGIIDPDMPLPCGLKPGTYDLVKTLRRIADLLPGGATFTLGNGEGGQSA